MLNAYTGEPGWVDASRVGPVAADDGLAAVPDALYVVQPGDTLSEIAETTDTSVDELVASNPDLDDPDRLSIGQDLDVP